jgi:hypothetical protein
MRGYRDLFEREFAGTGAGNAASGAGSAASAGKNAKGARLRDINGSGLPLGIETISLEQAINILNEGKADRGLPPKLARTVLTGREKAAAWPSPEQAALIRLKTEVLISFIRREQEALLLLRSILKGEIPAEADKTEYLLDTCDYLWAHFPDCAGAGGRRPAGTDLSFLKRVRTEIDPFLKLWALALKEAES